MLPPAEHYLGEGVLAERGLVGGQDLGEFRLVIMVWHIAVHGEYDLGAYAFGDLVHHLEVRPEGRIEESASVEIYEDGLPLFVPAAPAENLHAVDPIFVDPLPDPIPGIRIRVVAHVSDPFDVLYPLLVGAFGPETAVIRAAELLLGKAGAEGHPRAA